MKNSRRLIAFLLCFVIALSAVVLTASASVTTLSGNEWKYYRPITVNGVETGALYTQQLLGTGNKYSGSSTYKTVVNAVEIPAGSSSVTLEVINCGSYINSKDKVGNAMVSYNSTHSGETVIAATNADPWIMHHRDYDGDGDSSTGTKLSETQVSMSRGILIIDGELWATPQCDNENYMAYTSNAERGTSASSMAFAVTYANTYLFGCPKFYINVGNSTTGTSTGTYFNTATNSGVNRLPAPNSLIVYNQRVGTSSKAYSDAYEVYINTAATGGSGSSAIKIGTTVTGVVEHIYASGETNRAAIGANTIVLSARGSAISKIQGKYSVGDKATVTVTPHTDVSGHTSNNLSVWATVREAVGGWWETVKNGVVSGQLTNSNMYPAPMIGIKQDGTAVMMTVTTNTDGVYTGVRNKNLGDVAKDLGCYNAIVFDGGGSAFMATLEGSTYVRRTSASDGTNSCRSVTSVLAAVYHGADLNVSYSSTGTQQYLTSSQNPSTTTPTTYNNMSYIEYINGTRVSGLTAMPGVPVSTAFSGSIASPYTLSVQGWSIADGGGNLGIYYKVNNQSNWVSAQDVTTYSVAGEDVLGTVRAQASFTNISGVNGRFTSNINLSSYAGQSVDVKLGVGTAASTVSEFLNITGVQVGTVTASTNNGSVTWKYPFYSTVSAVQGTVTSLVGMRDVNYQVTMSDAEKQACLMPAVGSGFEAPSKSLSISGYAIVNGGVGNGGKIYWSTDKTTWTECSGTTISNATQANLTTAQTNGNVTGGTVTNAAFTNATADLDAYDGQTVDVYFATTSGDSNYIHFLTLEDVAVGSAASSGSGSGSGSGSSTPPTTTTAYNNVSSIDSINGYGLTNVGATSGNPFTMALPTGAAMMSHTFTIDRGWAVGENGFNGGINYSLDGGATWQGTSNGACADGGTNYYTPSDTDEYNAILGIANGAGFSGCTNARFQSLYIDLSAYAGQTVNVTLGVNTSSSTAAVSVIGTFTGVAVPTTSYENGAISIDKINGVTTGVGNVTANSGVLSTALPAGCEMTSTSFSICGWAIVNGQATSQNCMFVSVDGGATWIQMTGTYQGLNVRQDIYNAINANPAGYGLTDYDVYAAFATGLSADLSSYAGFTVDITVAVLQADSTKRPLVKFTGVTVPGSHTHSYQYASTGNGTHTATCSSPACSYSETVVCTSGTTWYGDGTYHWHKCAQCSAEVTSTKVAHSGTATCTAAATCTVCSQTFGSAAGHTIVEIEGEAATCTSTGWSTGEKCSVCNTIITERAQIPATGHTSVVVPAVAATCTSKGLTEGARCLDCGTVLTAQTETPMTAHNYVDGECTVCGDTQCPHTNVTDIAAIEATCTTGGKTAGQVCDDCGEILLEQTDTDALGHVERVITGKAATCTEDGLSNGKDCSRCNVILEAQTKINKLGHTEQVVSGTAATCVSTGLTDGKICSVCGTTIQAQTVIEKTAHTQQTISGTPATCTEDGTSDSVICSVCKAVITAPTTITKTGHSYTNYVYNNDATCTAAGTETALCSNGCGTSNTITSTEHPATDHSWSDATCTLPQICSSCKSTQGSPLGHQFTTFTSNGDATCQADGTKTATCDREGCSVQSTVTDTGSQTTHKYTTYTSDGNATCTADGTKTASCAYGCGTKDTVADTGSMIAHSWASTYSHDDTHHWYACTYGCGTQNSKAEHDLSSGSCVCGLGCEHTSTVDVEAVAATCTSTGKTAGKKCSVCGQITEGCADVPKLAHTEVAIGTAQAATCTETGITAGKKCSVCNTIIEAQQTIDALGHDTETHAAQASTCQVAGWNEYVTCKRAGCTYTTKQELALAEHSYTSYTSNNNATCTADGTKTASCDYGCGTQSTVTDTGSMIPHDWETTYSHDSTHHWYACKYNCGTQGSKTAHTEVAVGTAQAATCTEAGITAGKKCSVCTTIIEEQQTIDALGHDTETHAAQASTCQVAGWNEYVTCKRTGCTYSTKQELELAEHSYTTYTSDGNATCTTDGTKTASCEYGCGTEDTVTDTDSALGHDKETHAAQASTCQVKGWDEYETCKREGCTYTTKQELPLAAHNYTTYTSNNDATCENNATETAECTYGCGTEDTRTIPNSKVDHDYVDGACKWCGEAAEIDVKAAIDTINGISFPSLTDWPITGDKPFTFNWVDYFGSGNAKTNFQIKFWGIATGGQTLAYSIGSNGAWTDLTTGRGDRDDVVNHFTSQGYTGFVGTNAGFEGTIDLSAYAGQTISINLAVKTTEGEYVRVVTINNYQLTKKFVGNIDFFNSNTVASVSGNSKDGIIKNNLGTLPDTTLWIGGWIMIDGGQQNRLAWSVNGGSTWNDISGCGTNAGGEGHINAANAAGLGTASWDATNATFSMSSSPLSLAAYAGQTITISFAGIATDGTPVIFAELTVTVPGVSGCTHSVSTWTSLGNGTHFGYCTVCSVKVVNNCTEGTTLGHDDTHHWTQCSVCSGVIVKTAHSGGTASCTDLAVCTTCSRSYGTVDATNHTGTLSWTYTDSTHTGTYSCCDATVEGSHNISNGTCTDCGYVVHDHVYTNTVSSDALKTPATCISPAVYYKSCSTCNALHATETFTSGSVDSSNHAGPFTWTTTATTHTKVCGACEGTAAEGDHTYSSLVDTTCNDCGYTRDLAVKWSGFIDMINYCGPNGTTSYGDAGKISHNIADWGTRLTTSLPDSTLTLKGWLVVEEGHDGFAYSIDGGTTWIDATGTFNPGGTAHITVAEGDGISDPDVSAICFEYLNIDLSAYKGQTVNEVKVAFKKGDDKVCFATITNVSVPSERWAAIINTIDGASGFGSQSGSQINGALNIFHNTTLTSTTLSIDGWMLIDGGQTGISWSVNDGATWNVLSSSTQATYETPADLSPYIQTANIVAGTGSAWSATDAIFHLNIDLSSEAGKTVTVKLARTVASNPTAAVPFAEVNVTVPGTASHVCANNVQNVTFNNNNTHSGTCSVCGNTVKVGCTVSSTYTTDSHGHWKVCTVCNGIQNGTYAPHNIDNSATCAEGKQCSVCNYVAAEPTECTPGPAATCTNAQVCTVCGAIIADKLAHTLVQVEAQAPTCAAVGWSAYEYCSNCSYTTKQEIAKVDHTRPTQYDCTAGCYCTVCETLIEEAKDAHTPSIPAATCSEAQVCTVCQTVMQEKTPHTPNRDAATCTLSKVCTECDAIIEEATGHTMGDWEISQAATCVTAGQEQRKCTTCGEILDTEVIEATGVHSGGTATCTDKAICDSCGQEYGNALGHTDTHYEAQTETCYQIGWNAYDVCYVCGRSTYQEIPRTAHSTVFVPRQEPTCTATGLGAYEYCQNDGCSYTTIDNADVIEATGHVYDNVCADTDCNVCGHIRPASELEAHVGGEATCTTKAICDVCKNPYGDLDGTKHTGTLEYAAIDGTKHQQKYTCCGAAVGDQADHTGEKGCSTICNVCGGTRDSSTLVHEYNEEAWESDGTNHYHKCLWCDATKDSAAHTYSNVCADLDCDVCGYVRPASELGEHTGGTATCTAAPTCSACDQTYGAPLGHSAGAAATCTTPQVCTRCNAQLQAALGHQWSTEYTTDASNHWFVCENECGEITGEEAHDYSSGTCVCGLECPHSTLDTLEAVDATCTTTGLKSCKQCAACKKLFTLEGTELTEREVIDAKGHKYSNYVSNGDATCTEDGTKTAYCDNECGQTQTVEDTGSATGHSWGNDADAGWTQTKAPSCTEPGEKKRTCTNEGCQYSETEEIEANGHSYDWTIISNADCEHSGLKKYLCTVCEAEDPDTPGQVIEALGHIVETPETLVQTVQPTCTTDGYYVYRCSRCNTYEKNVEDESLKAKGHTEIDVPGKEATCTEDGYTAGKKCSVCGTWTQEPTTINKGSHSWDAGVQTKAPSCTEQGEKTFTCSKCNETRVEVIEMIAHDTEYGTSDTQHWVKCKICSYTEARENHTWEAGACTVCGHECTHTGGNATCEVKAVCEWCGESYGSYADHVWVTVSGYAATCEATGLTDGVQCSVCETWQTEQTTIEAKGHSYTNYVSDGNATCTENGTKTAQCDNGCGGTHTLTVENSSLGHAWGVETNDGYVQVTAPSCAVDGKETRTCTRCDLSEDRTIPATGHSNADDCEWTISKPATCTEDGEKVKICTKCLTETLATQSIPATGHSWGDDANAGWVETTAPTCTDAGEKTRICSNVGCTHTETATVPYKGHTESTTWTTKTEATCTEDGLEYTECTVCGEQMSTRPITQTGHSWGDTPTATTPATCTEAGVKIFTCTNGCGTTKTETIDATGHTEVVDEAVEATCTEHGKTEGKHCSVCNTVIVAQEETALADHTPETVAGRAPTCTVEGLTDGSKCSKCETVLEAQVSIPLIAHTLATLEGTPAGCLTEGIEEASQCSVCNKMFNLQGAEITQRVVLSALGHDHAKVNTVAATCTTGGYDLWKCVRCDDSYTENEQPATGHTYDNDFDTECNVCGAKRDPICDHVWEFECSTECSKGCGTTRPASHSYETVEGVAATCTAAGLKECQRCVYCQQLFENGVKIDAQPTIDALGHNTVTHVAQAPTCTTIGWDAYETCSRCSYTTYVEKPETGHTEVTDAAVAATCTSEGKTEGKHCSVCDTVIIAQSVTDMIDHTYEDVLGKNATCTEDGLEPARKCTMCLQLFDDDDNVIEAQVTIPAAGHSMVEARVPATCTTDGYTRHVCKVCMHEDAHTDTVPATGHTETYWCISKNATCTEAGSKYEVCRKCNTATGETDTIDALGCSFTITINIPATCEAGGKQIKKCSVCGAQEEVSSTPATGHVSTEWIVTKDATCNETGLKKEICKTCGKTVQSDVVIEKTTDHIYTSSVTAPTCLEGGCTTYTCVLCSNTYTADEVEALGHTDSDWIIETAATCSAAGSKYKKCTICGEETARESITKLEHSYRVTERVDATCKVDGSITYECTLCDGETEGHSKVDVLTKTGCQSGGWTVVDKASCTAAGSKEERCQICGDVMNTATIDKIPHNYITKVTESTCTVAGKVEMTCSVCDDYKSTPKELAPHVSDVDNGWVIATPATCTTDGTKNEICKNCGGVMNTQTIDALGHSWTAFEEKATCTAEGRSGEICTVCGETRNITVLEHLEHVSGGWTIDTAATCTTPGLKHEVCKTCGIKMGDGVVIEATNHEGTLVEKVTAPTCTADGYTTYTCTACEYSYTGNTVDATGHTAGDWVIDTDATCTNKGTKHQICATCGEKIADSDTEIEVKPHSYKVSVTAPTCTTDGYTTHTCSECGNSYTDNEVTAAGHTKSDWITDTTATCTANGSRHTVCTVCEVEIDREDIISSGHSYGEEIVVAPVCAPSDEGAKNGYTLRVCSACGDMKRTNETTPSHTLVTDPARDATCTAPGLTAGEHCSSCGKITVAQTEVDKLAHTYDTIYDRYCKVCGSLKEDATVCNHSYDDCEDATCNIEGCGYVRVAPGHLVVIVPGHAATCNSEGIGDGTKCTVCNKTLTTGDVIEATGHNPSLKDAEGNAKATCESDSICTYCGEILAYARAVHGSQTREETVVEATCTSEGYTREICLLCEKEIGNYKTVAKKSHTESDWKVDIAATCGMSGLRYTECTACHAVMNTEEIPATNEHSGGEATCSAKAICEVCGSSYGELGDHKLGDAATCTNAQYCLACKAEMAPKLAHSYDSGVVEIAATCAQSGTMKYTCGACNAEKRETIEKTSTHTPGAEATCTDPQVCAVCEAVITEAKGHKGGSATCMTQAECTICGTHYGTVDADAHTYDNDCDRYCNECGAQREPSHITQTVTGSAATCTADGLTDGVKCTRCNEWITEQAVIPANGHHFENGSCTGCGKEVCKSEHAFDDCADTTCNNCGYVRVAPGHNYISNCAEECTECGNIRIPTTAHTWSGDCDETCNVCGGGRDVEAGHTFEYACSDKCSVCNAKNPSIGAHTPINVTCNSYGSCSSCGIALTEGVYAEHEYTGCDTHCKVCGAERTVTHKLSDTLVYDGNKHWKECEDCGYKAEIADHEFDNICDSKCDDCGYTRKTEHIRDVNRVNDGDAHWYVCTICNEVIERVAHVYDNACDSVCNVCDYTREVSAHVYGGGSCDADCDICGYVRSIAHVYDNDCDDECNECGNKRSVSEHIYLNACDTACFICGQTRTDAAEHTYKAEKDGDGHWSVCEVCGHNDGWAAHSYKGCEDAECAVCGYERSDAGKHAYTASCDKDCNICGYVRTNVSDHKYAFICSRICTECGDVRDEANVNHVLMVGCIESTCMYCDYTTEGTGHTYKSDCSAECQTCHELREDVAPHTYTSVCSIRCSKCNEARELPEGVTHTYDFECSAGCSVCGETREMPAGVSHTYEYQCAPTCTVCGYTRAVSDDMHLYRLDQGDGSGHWDACLYCDAVKPGSKVDHNFRYYTNGDGTHRKVCRSCGYEAVEACVAGGGVCTVCEGTMPEATSMVYALPEMTNSVSTPVSLGSSDESDKDNDKSSESENNG